MVKVAKTQPPVGKTLAKRPVGAAKAARTSPAGQTQVPKTKKTHNKIKQSQAEPEASSGGAWREIPGTGGWRVYMEDASYG